MNQINELIPITPLYLPLVRGELNPLLTKEGLGEVTVLY